MDQLLTILIMCGLIYLIIKISSALWRFLGIVLLVAVVWFFKDQILLFVQNILDWLPFQTTNVQSTVDDVGVTLRSWWPF